MNIEIQKKQRKQTVADLQTGDVFTLDLKDNMTYYLFLHFCESGVLEVFDLAENKVKFIGCWDYKNKKLGVNIYKMVKIVLEE